MMKSPPSTPEEFTTFHIPIFSDTQRRCVVCYKEGRGDFRVRSYCNAPQCQKCMHVSKGWDCFAVFHSKPQANFADVYSNVFRCCVSQKYQKKKKKTFFTLLLLSLSVEIVVIWSLFSQGGLSLVSRDVKRQIHSPSNTSGPTHPPVIKSNFPTNFFFPANFLE